MTVPDSSKVTGPVTVLANENLAVGIWKVRIQAPALAAGVGPGQFLMLRLPNKTDPLLARAFAVYSTCPDEGTLDVVYATVGKMTNQLTQVRAGQTLEATGPLGNGWSVAERALFPAGDEIHHHELDAGGDERHFMAVAGGVGQTPFYMLAKKYVTQAYPEHKVRFSLLCGTRSQDRFACLDDFGALGIPIHLATEDGSAGTRGFVSDLIEPVMEQSGIRPGRTTLLACGPQAMLKAVFLEAKRLGLGCWVSLESGMGCGLGICYGCVVRVRDNQDRWDYRRICIDGPVFDAWRLDWDGEQSKSTSENNHHCSNHSKNKEN